MLLVTHHTIRYFKNREYIQVWVLNFLDAALQFPTLEHLQ
jgi:hypothetical protein